MDTPRLVAIDTEDTGLDFRHGAKPFIVSACDASLLESEGQQPYWEWEVNPKTRQPVIPSGDLRRIKDLIFPPGKELPTLVLQNPKFDVTALSTILPGLEWPWERTFDTLIAGHLLATNHPHDLTSMTSWYLGVDIKKYEDATKEVVQKARNMVRNNVFLKGWRIAKPGLPEMPSIKQGGKRSEDNPWKNDLWLPRAVAKRLKYPEDHPWHTVTRDYAQVDVWATVNLWPVMRREIERRGLWKIYLERLKVLPIAYDMECRGVTLSEERLKSKQEEYERESERLGKVCVDVAASHGCHVRLGKGARNDSITNFLFNDLKLPVRKWTKKGNASLDAAALEDYCLTLNEGTPGHTFCRSLRDRRKRETAVQYMNGYRRFWRPWVPAFPGAVDPVTGAGWWKLHPNLNPTGTNTLRWSCSSPNEQNISKKEDFNLRYAFGPAPGREWWGLDAKNIELRIPAYESGEEEFIALFERPDDPPYYGSNHLLVAHILHKQLFEDCRGEDGRIDGRIFKKRYASTWYQWVKNGNFAVQYGSVDKPGGRGTADLAYHVPGAQSMIKARFRKQEALNQKQIAFANKHGYVETMPDRTVDPSKGFPILCSRTENGRVKPTVPLNYHVQGTAMWWTQKAMIRTWERIKHWQGLGWDGFLCMQVHDELVFDFPRGKGSEPWKTNLNKVGQIKRLMEIGGQDIGIPTPASVEYHADNWAEGASITI